MNRIYYGKSDTSEVYFTPESTTRDAQKEDTSLLPKVQPKRAAYINISLCSLIVSLGLTNFGFNNVVTNTSYHVIKKFFEGSKDFDFLWSLAVSIFAIGGMFGAFIGPHVAKKMGRKKTLIVNNLLVILGGVLLFWTKQSRSVTMLCVARVIVGLNAGANTVVAPMYLSEIAPLHLRGSLGTVSQLGIVTGLLLGNVLGMKTILGNIEGWPYLLGITAVIGGLQLVFLPFIPESPRWLIAVKNNDVEAIKVLKKLRASDDVSSEVSQIKHELQVESYSAQVKVLELFCNGYYHKPLLISVVLQLSQQLSGIGGILFYSTQLFVRVGLTEKSSQIATCGVGALSVVMTLVVIYLVEVVGRRKLMLLGLGGMSLLYVAVTVCFCFDDHAEWARELGIVATLSSVAIFQIGPGAIPWFIVNELFSQASISAAVSVTGPTNWLTNFCVGLVFPDIDRALYPYTFIPFMILLLFFFVFTYFFVPETKGRTICEINTELHGTNSSHNEF